jgi:hypothetical protein
VFRYIFTLENDGDQYAKMLVVALDNNRRENTSNIKLVNIALDCPWLCDAPLSEIIFNPKLYKACNP